MLGINELWNGNTIETCLRRWFSSRNLVVVWCLWHAWNVALFENSKVPQEVVAFRATSIYKHYLHNDLPLAAAGAQKVVAEKQGFHAYLDGACQNSICGLGACIFAGEALVLYFKEHVGNGAKFQGLLSLLRL